MGYSRYYDEQIFEQHLAFVKNNLDVLDEITVFADFSHYGYWSLEYTTENGNFYAKESVNTEKSI